MPLPAPLSLATEALEDVTARRACGPGGEGKQGCPLRTGTQPNTVRASQTPPERGPQGDRGGAERPLARSQCLTLRGLAHDG